MPPTSMPKPEKRASLVVAADEAGERLDRVLARHVGELSRSRLKALIEAGAVAIDGQHDPRSEPSRQFRRRNRASTCRRRCRPSPQPEAIPLPIVYEDDDIIVIDKPRNLVVHPAAGHWTGTLVNALIAHCGDSLSGIGGERRPGIVHRLDKDTTGADGRGQERPRPSRARGTIRRSRPRAANRSSAATSPLSGARRTGRTA